MCWGPVAPGSNSYECAACAELTLDERAAWLRLDDLLSNPPFRVWPKRARNHRNHQQPGQAAQDAQFLCGCASSRCPTACGRHGGSCILRQWLYVGDLDDTRKVARGDGPADITHILCLCPEHLRNTEEDQEMRQGLAEEADQVTSFGNHPGSSWRHDVLSTQYFVVFSRCVHCIRANRSQLAVRHVEMAEIRANDSPSYQILDRHLEQSLEVATRARNVNGAVLVQCWGGCNRAPSIAVALLMKLDRAPLLSACQQVQEVRGEILTNRGFRRQLLQLAVQDALLPCPGLCNAEGPYTWDTGEPEELVLLLWFALLKGTGLAHLDSSGRSAGDYLTEAAARRSWRQHGRLVRRLMVLGFFLGPLGPAVPQRRQALEHDDV